MNKIKHHKNLKNYFLPFITTVFFFCSCALEETPIAHENLEMTFSSNMSEAEVAMDIFTGNQISIDNILNIPYETTKYRFIQQSIPKNTPYLAVIKIYIFKAFDLTVSTESRTIFDIGSWGTSFHMFLDPKGDTELVKKFKTVILPYLRENYSTEHHGSIKYIFVWVVTENKTVLLDRMDLE